MELTLKDASTGGVSSICWCAARPGRRYKVGHSEILAQRARARRKLGARYDLRDFDDAVVGGGNVPLDVLGTNVSRYIAEKKAS